MLGLRQSAELESHAARPARKQPRQLLVALFLLLAALIVVVMKDRDFWLGTDDGIEADATNPASTPKAEPAPVPARTNPAPETPVATAINSPAPKSQPAQKPAKPAVPSPSHKDLAARELAAREKVKPAVATKRAVLPPLDVEVVAAGTHHAGQSAAQPASDSAKVEISANAKRVSSTNASTNASTSAPVTNLPTNAAERESISPSHVPELQQTVGATYPLLGQHTRVQGSVVLQAVVGADGVIENLRVVSGPSILAMAAQQAVRQWHFKPFLQNGQPVETKATITVNFTIRVANNTAAS